jgi:hypothetical protein
MREFLGKIIRVEVSCASCPRGNCGRREKKENFLLEFARWKIGLALPAKEIEKNSIDGPEFASEDAHGHILLGSSREDAELE